MRVYPGTSTEMCRLRKIENEQSGIMDVWQHNVDREFFQLQQIAQNYHYIAIDTEFPGCLESVDHRVVKHFGYQNVVANVKQLNVIQIGFSFFTEDGQNPQGFHTWQFNLKFNLRTERSNDSSIRMLRSIGMNFEDHEKYGIDPEYFAARLISSGIVLDRRKTFMGFHCAFDFAYILKLLKTGLVPQVESRFFAYLNKFFPNVYDLKYLMKSCRPLKGGLQDVANYFDIRRLGIQHQAGSDSWVTGVCFFKIRDIFFANQLSKRQYCNLFYFLGGEMLQEREENENVLLT